MRSEWNVIDLELGLSQSCWTKWGVSIGIDNREDQYRFYLARKKQQKQGTRELTETRNVLSRKTSRIEMEFEC